MAVKWVTRTSKNPKHAGVVFIMDGDVFVAKTYNHDGADGAATAKLIIDRVNGWDALRERAEAAEREVDELNARIGNLT